MKSLGSILIIDDNENNLKVLTKMLSGMGYGVTSCPTGIDGLFHLAGSSFDLILLDLMLPDISGYEILEKIRQEYTMIELPVIMLTAINRNAEIVQCLSMGANDYVTKPYDISVIQSRIQTQIRLVKAESSLRISEERYTLAAQATHDGLWDWNIQEMRFYISGNYRRMLGNEELPENIPEQHWFDYVHPADLEKIRAMLENIKNGEKDRVVFEHRIIHRDGSSRWIQTTAISVKDKKGQVSRIIASASDITDGKLYNSLSHLPNNLLIQDRVEQALQQIKSGKNSIAAVLFIDLDRFRFINQVYGIINGDAVLLEVIGRLKELLGNWDTLAHPGRDEFIILLESPENLTAVTVLINRIQQTLQTPVQIPGLKEDVLITCSIGVVIIDSKYENAKRIIQDAESAMTQAKKDGLNRFHFFREDIYTSIRDHMDSIQRMRSALKKDEFILHYQPQMSIADGSLLGFEALIRWDCPGRELIMPGQFVTAAEENGMIKQIGESILETACAQIREWAEMGLPRARIAVNLSPLQFSDRTFIDSLISILDVSGIDADCLEFEITESKAMENPQETIVLMERLRELGISFSLDDFGTGYSSLSMLQQFPLSTLKIDKTFVNGIQQDDSARSIIEAIIAMARSLKFSTIAEGVEEYEQLEFLKNAGCEFYQGYYKSKALSPPEATKFLRKTGKEMLAEERWS